MVSEEVRVPPTEQLSAADVAKIETLCGIADAQARPRARLED